MTQRGRPRDPSKRKAILNAACRLFLEHGVIGVSMDQIAEASAVSKRTIYSLFTDKETLLHAVIRAQAGDFHPPLIVSREIADLHELNDWLVQYGIQLLRLLTQPTTIDLGRLLITECRRHPELARQFHNWGPQASHEQISQILTAASRTGLLEISDCAMAAEQLLSMWTGPLLKQQLGLAGRPTQQQLQHSVASAVDVLVRAYAVSTWKNRSSSRNRG